MSEAELKQELAKAQDTIATLQQELTETNREVMALTLDLEKRVEERTAELRAANRRLKEEIVERKEAEKALRQSETRYATIAENLPNGVVHVLDRELRYVFNAGEQLRELGMSHETLVGRTVHDVLPPRRAEPVLAHFTRALEGEKVSFEAEYHDRTFLVNAVPLHRSSGHVDEILVLSLDITRRKEAERALQEYSERLEEMVEERTRDLRAAQERMVRQEKLATLGRLAGSVSHELRNPLGAIKNAAYFLTLAVQEPDPDVQEALEILEREVDRSEGVIKGLLDFARSEPPVRQDVDLNAILKQTLRELEVPEGVKVVAQLDDDLPVIRGDPNQLRQVFHNIMENGVQAMSDGGRLVVESTTADGQVEVAISDTGSGVPEHQREQIFEPLFTTKMQGIGLGLAIVKTLVEGHEGTVDVHSPSGRAFRADGKEYLVEREAKGTTFTVQLPVDGGTKVRQGARSESRPD